MKDTLERAGPIILIFYSDLFREISSAKLPHHLRYTASLTRSRQDFRTDCQHRGGCYQCGCCLRRLVYSIRHDKYMCFNGLRTHCVLYGMIAGVQLKGNLVYVHTKIKVIIGQYISKHFNQNRVQLSKL